MPEGAGALYMPAADGGPPPGFTTVWWSPASAKARKLPITREYHAECEDSDEPGTFSLT